MTKGCLGVVKMRAAVIGLGRVGYEFCEDKKREQPASHVACYNQLGVDALAVVDVDVNKLPPAMASINSVPSKRAYMNVAEMMLEFRPHIVSVCTPTSTHRDVVLEVVKHESVKAILLEKPIAQSLKEADEIIDACGKKRIRLWVNYARRWDPVYVKWFGDRASEPSGEIKAIIGHHHGPLLRTGTHMLDLFNWITKDSPISVQAFGTPRENYVTGYDVIGNLDYNISGCVSYASRDNDVEAVLYSGESKSYLLFEVDIFFEKGRLRITDNGGTTEVFRSWPSDRYTGLEELVEELGLMSTSFNHALDGIPYKNPLLNAINQTLHLGQGFAHHGCSGLEARETLHVALALHYSAMNNNMRVRLQDVPRDYAVRSQ